MAPDRPALFPDCSNTQAINAIQTITKSVTNKACMHEHLQDITFTLPYSHEKRKHLGQLVKKIERGPKRRSLPFGDSYLFHNELGAGAGQLETVLKLDAIK